MLSKTLVKSKRITKSSIKPFPSNQKIKINKAKEIVFLVPKVSITSKVLREGADESDAELVFRLKAGQHKVLAILYKRYAGLVYSVAYKILQNRQEAEDLTQDIFVTFWKQNRFEPNRGALSSFLGLLTRSRAIDKIRSRNTNQNFLARWQKLFSERASEMLPLEQVSLEERQHKLQQALEQLPILQRRILEMNYFQGLSQAKIAKALNLTLGTVKSRSRQGLLQLKELLLELRVV